jgi:uroporphyrinogen III methyltransferase/synthase
MLERLSTAGAEVEQVAAYAVVRDCSDAENVIEKLEADRVDWITFTSSRCVECFLSAVEPELVAGSAARLASIGPRTSQTLRGHGLEPAVEASPHTISGLLAAIVRWEENTSAE